MGMVSFIMLIAGGYAYVVNQTGAVDTLIDATLAILGASKVVFVIVLIIIGLLITMGIGTSFGTIPVIALFYVPMCMKMNMSVGATACLYRLCQPLLVTQVLLLPTVRLGPHPV